MSFEHKSPRRSRSRSRRRRSRSRSRGRSRSIRSLERIRFRDEPREKIYCGNSDVLPPGYDRFGTRYECLRKGYGSALLAPEYKRREAMHRAQMRGYRRLSRDDLFDLAASIGISTTRPDGTYKTQLQLLNEIIPIIRAMAL